MVDRLERREEERKKEGYGVKIQGGQREWGDCNTCTCLTHLFASYPLGGSTGSNPGGKFLKRITPIFKMSF